MKTDEIKYHIDSDGKFLLDENGNPILKTICICCARQPLECVCGAWDDVTDWDYDSF